MFTHEKLIYLYLYYHLNISLPSFHFISTTNGVYQNKCVFWLPLFAKSSFYIERDCYKEGKLWQEASILWCPSRMNYIIGTLRNNERVKVKMIQQLFLMHNCFDLWHEIIAMHYLIQFFVSNTRISILCKFTKEISESNISTKLNISSIILDIFCLNTLSALKT